MLAQEREFTLHGYLVRAASFLQKNHKNDKALLRVRDESKVHAGGRMKRSVSL